MWTPIDMSSLDAVIAIHVPVHHYRLTPITLACICMQTFEQWHCYTMDDPDGQFDLGAALSLVESWGIEVDRTKFTAMQHPDSDWLHDKRNMLIDSTSEPVICNMDDDDYFYPSYLEVLIANLLQDDETYGTFRGHRQSYHLLHRFLVEDYVAGSGSGHWMYRREWRDKLDIRYDVYVHNGVKLRRASDDIFLKDIEAKDHTFNRRLVYFTQEKGLSIRIRHGHNTCRFGLRGLDDPDLLILKEMVDQRVYPYYVEVANQLLTEFAMNEPELAHDNPIVCMATYGRQRTARDTIIFLAREAPQVIVWNNDDYDLGPLPANVRVIKSPINIGPIGRFLAAMTSEEQHVLFWDDDMLPVEGYYNKWCRFLPWVRQGAIVGHHAFRFIKDDTRYDNRQRVKGNTIEHADYVGTGGMLCPRKYVNTRPVWNLSGDKRFCSEDIALCVGARAEHDANLLGVPGLKKTFTWQDELNKTALFKTHFTTRLKAFLELFPDHWEYAEDRNIRLSHPMNNLERDGEGLFNGL